MPCCPFCGSPMLYARQRPPLDVDPYAVENQPGLYTNGNCWTIQESGSVHRVQDEETARAMIAEQYQRKNAKKKV